MAKQMPVTFQFPRTTTRYPWTQWLDGRVWLLEPGADYAVEQRMRTAAWQQAHKLGLQVSIRKVRGGTGVYLQASAKPATRKAPRLVRGAGDGQ